MKKHTVIMRNAEGALVEGFLVTEDSARTLKGKNIPGLVSITSSARVNHPSPAVMTAALKAMGVNLTDFYTACENIKATAEDAAEDTTEGAEDK